MANWTWVEEIFLQSQAFLLEISRRGHWKRGICIKLSEIDFQIRDKFATILRTLPLMYKTKCRQFCANLARNLRNAPLTPSRDFRFLLEHSPDCRHKVFFLITKQQDGKILDPNLGRSVFSFDWRFLTKTWGLTLVSRPQCHFWGTFELLWIFRPVSEKSPRP